MSEVRRTFCPNCSKPITVEWKDGNVNTKFECPRCAARIVFAKKPRLVKGGKNE